MRVRRQATLGPQNFGPIQNFPIFILMFSGVANLFRLVLFSPSSLCNINWAGFGFITFKDTDSIEMAQAKENAPHHIDGRDVESKRAMPRNADGQAESSVSTKKMFVGGVKDGMTEDDIRNLFSQEGAVEQVNMVTDKATGKLKPFCFVTFEETDITDKCVCK